MKTEEMRAGEGMLPLEIRNVSPSPEAVRLITGAKLNGMSDGVHTGGAWLWKGEVWKPLDGRPYMNANFHTSTQEAEVLEEMAGEPLFPRNWRVEELNGRRFLVRQRALVLPGDISYQSFFYSRESISKVEAAIRNLNRHGWEVGDDISVAYDGQNEELFILDMSCATKRTGAGIYVADEEWRILKFFEEAGHGWLKKLRKNARHATNFAIFSNNPGYRHVYASFYRPIDAIWAKLPDDPIYYQAGIADWRNAKPHTWVITKSPLQPGLLERFELEWGWSPIHSRSQER